MKFTCTECGWQGGYSEILNDMEEDSDGDLRGEYSSACPECHAYCMTDEETGGFDADDLGDDYGS